MLTKEQILSVPDVTTEVVPVPEWGGDVTIKMLTGAQRDRFEQQCAGIRKGKIVENLRARLVALCVIDSEGKRMFADTEIVDLGKKSAKALSRIFDACQKLSGLSDEDIEELEKNSEADPNDVSTSD